MSGTTINSGKKLTAFGEHADLYTATMVKLEDFATQVVASQGKIKMQAMDVVGRMLLDQAAAFAEIQFQGILFYKQNVEILLENGASRGAGFVKQANDTLDTLAGLKLPNMHYALPESTGLEDHLTPAYTAEVESIEASFNELISTNIYAQADLAGLCKEDPDFFSILCKFGGKVEEWNNSELLKARTASEEAFKTLGINITKEGSSQQANLSVMGNIDRAIKTSGIEDMVTV